MGITAPPTLAMARSWVPDPVFKSMPTPAALGLISARSTLSRGYGSGSLDPCVVGFGVRVLGFIGDGGHAQANGGVVPEFLDPFLVKTDLVVCKRKLMAMWVVRLDIMCRLQISSPAVVKCCSVDSAQMSAVPFWFGVVGRPVSL